MSDSQFVDVDLGNDNSVYGGTGLVERHLIARNDSFYPLRRVAAAIRQRATFLIAGHPSESRLQYSETPAERNVFAAKNRWHEVAKKVIQWNKTVKYSRCLYSDTDSTERFAAAVQLSLLVTNKRNSNLHADALEERSHRQGFNFWEKIEKELLNTGRSIFLWLTPAPSGEHSCFCTLALAWCFLLTFFFMCGDFRFYVQVYGALDTSVDSSHVFGATSLISWISMQNAWYTDGEPWSFTSPYLLEWGARYLPVMLHGDQFMRWLSSAFVHQNFTHLFSNLVLFSLLGSYLERKYGWWRVGSIFFVSHFCGALASAMLEDASAIVFGASGGIFGLMGFYVADWVVNFSDMRRPMLHLIVTTLSAIYFCGALVTTDNGTSHMSHIGGLFFGFYSSLIFLPRRKSERLNVLLTLVGGFLLVPYVAGATYYIYAVVMKKFIEKNTSIQAAGH